MSVKNREVGHIQESSRRGITKRHPRTTETRVAVGFRVSTTNRDKFANACRRLDMSQSDVIETFMVDFWRKFEGQAGDVREDYRRLKREADKLYDSLPHLRIPITHWERFKKLYTENGGDLKDWPERNSRSTLNLIYRKKDTILPVERKCPDCGGVVSIGHLDVDYRKFETYIEAKVAYAEMDRKLKQMKSILIQQEEGLSQDSTTEGEVRESEMEPVRDPTPVLQDAIASPIDSSRMAPKRIVTITGRELAETIQPARVSTSKLKENDTTAGKQRSMQDSSI